MVDEQHVVADLMDLDGLNQIIDSQEMEMGAYLHETSSGDLKTFDMFATVVADTSHLSRPPNTDEVENGLYNFEVNLPGTYSGKSTWVYSQALKKAFIKINTNFIVNISYNNNPMNMLPHMLYLHVMPIYTEAEDQHLAVTRCRNHQTGSDNSKLHIVTCKQPQVVEYWGDGDKGNYGDRLSIRIPMDCNKSRVDEKLCLEFMCQNSCTSGINRRCTALVFALETEQRVIVGKRLMSFKVCSCPKRDKEKEEQLQVAASQSTEKRKHDTPPSGSRKKIFKAVIKQENITPPPQSGDIKGVPLNLWFPNEECVRRIRQAAISELGAFIADNPEARAEWESYRQNLRDEQAVNQSWTN